MPTENITPNRSYQQPHEGNLLDFDVFRLINAIASIDTDVATLFAGLATKSDLGHGHEIAEINGLQTILNAKAALIHTHALDDLSNVDVPAPSTDQALIWGGAAWQASNITATMIASGVLAQDRLPAHLTPAALAAAYASIASLATKLDLTGGGTVTGNTEFQGTHKIRRDAILTEYRENDNDLAGYMYSSADAYWGLVPGKADNTPDWANRLAYDQGREKWAIGGEGDADKDVITRAELPDAGASKKFDIMVAIPDGDVVDDKTVILVRESQIAFTVDSVHYHQGSGNGEFTVRREGANIAGLVGLNPGGTWLSASPSSTTTVAVGEELSIVFDSSFGDDNNTHIQIKCTEV